MISVILLHVGGLWALQSGLLRRVVAALVIPAEVLIDMSPTEIDTAPAEPAPSTQQPSVPAPPHVGRTPAPQPAPAQAAPSRSTTAIGAAPLVVPATPSEPGDSSISPSPVAMTANSASVNNVAIGMSNSNTSTNSSTGSASPPGTAAAVSRAPALELPSSDAQYLNNPTPAYPTLSKRQGETGKVVIRTFIGVDGIVQQAQIKQSSGFDRLDQASLATALKWRFVPGKRAGVAEAMWFDVPFTWVLR